MDTFQLPMSAPCIEDGQLKFFPYQIHPNLPTITQQQQYQQHHQQQQGQGQSHDQGLDNTDHPGTMNDDTENKAEDKNKSEESKDEDVEASQQRQYKDACISPIGVIESPRKNVSHAMCSPIDGGGSDDENEDAEEKEDRDMNEIKRDTTKEDVAERNDKEQNEDMLDGGTPAMELENAREGGNESKSKENEATADDMLDDDFPSSEVFYANVRRASSCMSYFAHDMQRTMDEIRTQGIQTQMEVYNENEEDYDDNSTRSESSLGHNTEFMEHLDRMNALYFKLVSVNTGSENIEERGENAISWDMLDEEADRLICQITDSDDSKLIKICLNMFPQKERRQPLNTCIENLLEEKRCMQEKLNTKSKEIDRMVNDLWNHQKDMKNIEKLKKNRDSLQEENKKLREDHTKMEVSLNETKLSCVDRDMKIQELEGKIKDMEDKKVQASSPRRGASFLMNRRPGASIIGQVRRPAPESRIGAVQGGVSTSQSQSPRTVVTATNRRTTNTRR